MLARDVLEYEKINGKDDGNMKTLTAGFASALALSFFGLSLQAETLYWRGTSSELASVAANWSPEQVPTAADDIVLDADSANNPLTWDLNSGVASWTQSAGTVTFDTAAMKDRRIWRGAFLVRTAEGLSRACSLYAVTDFVPPFEAVEPGEHAVYLDATKPAVAAPNHFESSSFPDG